MGDLKTSIVTGATQGIGKAIALALLADGGRVIAIGRSPEKLDALGREARDAAGRLITEPLDIADSARFQARLGQWITAFGGIRPGQFAALQAMIRITTSALLISLVTLQPASAVLVRQGVHPRLTPNVGVALDVSDPGRERMARSKWPGFITRFRATVGHRDKRSLRLLMSPEFELNDWASDVPADPRDAALQMLDKSGGKGWRQLEQIQRHGTRFLQGHFFAEGYGPHRVAPPVHRTRGPTLNGVEARRCNRVVNGVVE
mgnify:CR=1 FL=1